jgi:ribosomal-protein-alanine N-acetyltransferase
VPSEAQRPGCPPESPTESRKIRAVRPDDAPNLAEILRCSPETVNWLPDAADISAAVSGGFLLVSESAQEVTGFLLARRAADEAEILNLAVHPANRRTGTATALLLAAFERFRAGHATRIFLEVRESNAPAIAFYRKHAFRQVGRRPNYYRQPDEAALILERSLNENSQG